MTDAARVIPIAVSESTAHKNAIFAAAEELMRMADEIDAMVKSTLSGAWSTHLVAEQRQQAVRLRSTSATLYRASL